MLMTFACAKVAQNGRTSEVKTGAKWSKSCSNQTQKMGHKMREKEDHHAGILNVCCRKHTAAAGLAAYLLLAAGTLRNDLFLTPS